MIHDSLIFAAIQPEFSWTSACVDAEAPAAIALCLHALERVMF